MPTPFTFQPGPDEEEDEWIYRVEAGACDWCLSYEGRIFKTSEILFEFPYAVFLFENIIEPRVHPNCRCQLRKIGESLYKEQLAMHKDFVKIQNMFITQFGGEEGIFEFNSWVADLGVNVNKPYGKSLESYKWAEPMITKWKADEENTYYKVPFAFPVESMNGNVYTEEEISQSVGTVIGKSPSINHWEDTRKDFEQGGVVYIAAEYEDGACEAILKVPNDFICPMCDKGKPLTEWIDEKKIVNVSLEATCKDVGPGNQCIGLEFDAPTLLTADTLPGIPMARIYPLEKVFSEALAYRNGAKKVSKKKIDVKVVGMREQLPDGQGQCPEGMIWNSNTGLCEQDTDCPDGQHWSDAEGKCVLDAVAPPEGTEVELGTPAAPDNSKAPVEFWVMTAPELKHLVEKAGFVMQSLTEEMTEDELKAKIADVASQIDVLYSDGIESDEMEVLQAELDGYKAALVTLIRANAVTPLTTEQGTGEPKTDAERAKAHFDISDAEWDALSDDEKQAHIDKLPPVGTGKEQTCPEGQKWDPETGQCIPDTGEQQAPSAEKAVLLLKLSELELLNYQTEQKFNSAEEQILFLQNEGKKLIVEKVNLEGQLKASHALETRMQKTIDKRDMALIEGEKSQAVLQHKNDKLVEDHREALDKATARADETASARDSYKDKVEGLKTTYDALDAKYNSQLDINLSQTRKLTKSSEDLLQAAQKIEHLETLVKKAKRLGKIVVQMNVDPEE